MSTPIKRRNFLGSLLLLFAFSRCKKESVAPGSNPIVTTPVPPVVSSDYLGQYSATETASGLMPEPDFIAKIIKCYSDKLTYYPGDTVTLYISGAISSNQLITFTDAAEKVVLRINKAITTQANSSLKPWLNGSGYKPTVTMQLPESLKSGVYRFIADGTVICSIICKSKTKNNDITVVYPSNTDNAYNIQGGKSLYKPDNARSTVASYARSTWGAADYTSGFLRWACNQPYDMRFISDPDLDDYTEIQDTKIIILAGHSEYWTREARLNIDKFIASGKNVLILSGNTMYFQVRYNSAKDLMICYKDKKLDPLGDTIYSTIFWSNPQLQYPVITSIGADFDGGGYGNKLPNGFNGYKIVNEKSPLFEGTGLRNGEILNLPTLEYDGAPVVKMIQPGSTEVPVIDNSKLNFYKIELLGYDFAINWGNKGLGTFIVFKKTAQSGTVVNVASTNWCATNGIEGKDGSKIVQITKKMIEKSLNNETLFTS
ncbi:MAG TPA: N,N-dimethylformamidase beta subunit family domain-containing protein [Mucilaginibacter sp.]